MTQNPLLPVALVMSHKIQIDKKGIFTCKLVSIENAGNFGENCPYTMLTFSVDGKLEKHGLADSKLLLLIKGVEQSCFKPY